MNERIEVRVTDPETGGQKGQKIQRYDLIPADALDQLATLYGIGCEKYDERNWERGYAWGLSFGALMRHAWAWWRGEEVDPESGLDHMTHVAWHALTLATFRRRSIGRDDRTLPDTTRIAFHLGAEPVLPLELLERSAPVPQADGNS